MKKTSLLLIASLVVVLVIATVVFLSLRPTSNPVTTFLEKYDLAGLSVEEIVYSLDSSKADPEGLSSSITSDYLILSDKSGEIKLALPEDKFYLSFAPYINQTHPCATHSLASCQGELVGKEVSAVIIDKDGNEIFKSDVTTMENGFVGMWLPREIEGTVTVTYDGLTAQAPISTYAGRDTCLTTLQLN